MAVIDFGAAFGFSSLPGAGEVGTIALVIGVSVLVMALVGVLIYVVMMKKTYVFKIHVWRRVGNQPTRVGIFKAKSIPVGAAGDTLWFVKGLKKYLPPGTIQSAPNEYWYWIREDTEWINFGTGDLDEHQKRAGVKYIHADMRMQRLATDRLLEQRLMQKSFWEKYQHVLMTIAFFLIIAISLVIFMYMFGKTTDKVNQILDKAIQAEQRAGGGNPAQLVPATLILGVPISLLRRKKCLYSAKRCP